MYKSSLKAMSPYNINYKTLSQNKLIDIDQISCNIKFIKIVC